MYKTFVSIFVTLVAIVVLPMNVKACEECFEYDLVTITDSTFVVNWMMDSELSLEIAELREYIQRYRPEHTIFNINYVDTTMNPWVTELFGDSFDAEIAPRWWGCGLNIHGFRHVHQGTTWNVGLRDVCFTDWWARITYCVGCGTEVARSLWRSDFPHTTNSWGVPCSRCGMGILR